MSQLSNLFLRNLVFSGVHGSTGREYLDPQSFRVDIVISLDVSRSATSDLLSDTYDYKEAQRIAESVIEGEKHVLIEKISSRIAYRICENPKVHKVRVTVSKPSASRNGVPGITVEHYRRPQEQNLGLLDFSTKDLLDSLDQEGAVSVPILKSDYRSALLGEAETYEYHKQPEVVGSMKVREQISSTYEFKEDSLFYKLRDDFQSLLLRKLSSAENIFNPPLDLNEMSLQLYEKDSLGITPHMDGLSNLNLICVFMLTGHAKFALCDDREGSNPRYLDTSPGRVIIMRAPGYRGRDLRPFHLVSDVTERRIVFGLRQKANKETSL
jgi:dihydroneopterin aldolase